MPQTDVAVEQVVALTDDVRALIGELDTELALAYAPEQRHGLDVEAIFKPHMRFFLARFDGAAVGCGGVALFDGFAEVKRMYVRDGVRGRGIARALLARIEAEAYASGRTVLRLETGAAQIAALRLYRRWGFRPCPAFAAYARMTAPAIATSVFLEKRLGGD